MRKVLRFVSAMPAVVAGIALFALMVLTFTDVMLRSLLNAPLQAGADLTRLLMAVVVFSILPVVSARQKHIHVDLLDPVYRRLRIERWRDAALDLVCGGLLLLPTQRIWVLAERNRSYGDVMEYLGLPVFITGWFIAAMTLITAVVLILRGGIGLVRPRLLEAAHD